MTSINIFVGRRGCGRGGSICGCVGLVVRCNLFGRGERDICVYVYVFFVGRRGYGRWDSHCGCLVLLCAATCLVGERGEYISVRMCRGEGGNNHIG